MNIKKYIARNAQEAIQMVKKEMGPEAVILRTRTLFLPDEGVDRSAGKIEVTAAVDYESPGAMPLERDSPEPWFDQRRWQRLEREIKGIKEALLSADLKEISMPELYFNRELRTRYTNLKHLGLKPEIIRDLMEEGPDRGPREGPPSTHPLQETLSRVLRRIHIAGPKKNDTGRNIYSFIGPTGVGKTTTLAKLAALSAIKQGKKTALITLDTFRIAAVAQLQTYARIIGAPLEVAASSDDLQGALRKHIDCDAIFIDTAGRSPNKDEDIITLKNLFSTPEEINHYLILSAATRFRNLEWAEERFGVLPIKSYIFTKLDETQDACSMVNFLASRQKPVSYFATGQQVPEDIEMASRKRVATLMLAGMRDTGGSPLREAN